MFGRGNDIHAAFKYLWVTVCVAVGVSKTCSLQVTTEGHDKNCSGSK